jgi:GT2 family glycosyltransferase
MIIFGTAITDPDAYEAIASPGIRSVAEDDSKILAHQTMGSLFRNYNLMLDMAAAEEEMEALVLVHQDAEIDSPDFCQKVRGALRAPDVAVVGCVGAIGVRSIAWWEGAVTWASFIHRYEELGGGDFEAMTFHVEDAPPFAQLGEVDSVDGFVLVLSPWAVRNLRFDESLGTLHGYDFDICCQARAAGKKVVTADFRAIHYHSLDLISDPDTWIEAHVRLAEKWNGAAHGAGDKEGDLQLRLLRAEAEAACAHAMAKSYELKAQASSRLLERVESSASWKLTRPLRAAKKLLRRGA